jgi:uncharacterized protein YbcV (DUF1398 family)
MKVFVQKKEFTEWAQEHEWLKYVSAVNENNGTSYEIWIAPNGVETIVNYTKLDFIESLDH